MRYILPLLALGLAVSTAHAQDSESLPALVSAFVTAERPDADAQRHEAISTCIIEAFDGIDDAELATIIDTEDFEESFDNLLEIYPDREAKIEICEDL